MKSTETLCIIDTPPFGLERGDVDNEYWPSASSVGVMYYRGESPYTLDMFCDILDSSGRRNLHLIDNGYYSVLKRR